MLSNSIFHPARRAASSRLTQFNSFIKVCRLVDVFVTILPLAIQYTSDYRITLIMVAAHILVIGATGKHRASYCFRIANAFLGPAGLEFCSAALEEGHQLTLYVRNPTKLPTDISGNAKVTVIQGTLEDKSGLQQAITSGATVFVSFAGPVANSKGTVRYTRPI